MYTQEPIYSIDDHAVVDYLLLGSSAQVRANHAFYVVDHTLFTLYPGNLPPSQYVDWKYLNNSQTRGVVVPSGSLSFDTASLASGPYELRLTTGSSDAARQVKARASLILASSQAVGSATSGSCSFAGQVIANGLSVTAYELPTVLPGHECFSEQRVCKNGVLSGSYVNASCVVPTTPPVSFTIPKINYAVGQPISVSFSGGVGTGDWVGLYPSSETNPVSTPIDCDVSWATGFMPSTPLLVHQRGSSVHAICPGAQTPLFAIQAEGNRAGFLNDSAEFSPGGVFFGQEWGQPQIVFRPGYEGDFVRGSGVFRQPLKFPDITTNPNQMNFWYYVLKLDGPSGNVIWVEMPGYYSRQAGTDTWKLQSDGVSEFALEGDVRGDIYVYAPLKKDATWITPCANTSYFGRDAYQGEHTYCFEFSAGQFRTILGQYASTHPGVDTDPSHYKLRSFYVDAEAWGGKLAMSIRDLRLESVFAAQVSPPTPSIPAPCSFNGQTIASGVSTTTYQSSSVVYGSQCVSQSRTCTNGTLSGSYTYPSCTVAPPVNASNPRGNIDEMSCSSIAGWAQDLDTPEDPVNVRVYIDDKLAAELPASDRRGDLCVAIGSCNHGFSVPVAQQYLDGNTHAVLVVGVDQPKSSNNFNAPLKGGTGTLQCATTTPS